MNTKQYPDKWDKKEIISKSNEKQLEKDKQEISKLWNIDFGKTKK